MNIPAIIDTYVSSYIPSAAKLNEQFWSTLIGAVVGGLIALGIQLLNYGHMRRQEKATQRKRDLTNATSMLLKAAKMFSSISHIDTHMRGAVALARSYSSSETGPPWQMVQPMVGKTPEVEFTDDERMFAVTELPKDFIDVLQMPDIHNSLIDLMNLYSTSRIELGSLMPAVAATGMLATSELTMDEYGKLMPRMLNLQSLVAPLIAQSAKAREDAIKTFELIKGAGREKFGKEFTTLELDTCPGESPNANRPTLRDGGEREEGALP